MAAPGVRVSGWLDGLAVVETKDGPRQRPQALGAIRLDATPTTWFRAHAEVRGRVGGPFEGGEGFGAYDFGRLFQNVSPAIEFNEAWGEVRQGALSLRAGIQKVAWGKLDGVPPTDVVNPRDFHDPIIQDPEERKIGIPMLLATWTPPDVPALDLSGLRASLLYVPWAVPPRLALLQERWFPTSIDIPDHIDITAGQLADIGLPLGRDLRIPFDVRTRNDRPSRALDKGGVGVRLSGTLGVVDWDLYHYSGPETTPNVDLITYVQRQGPFMNLDIRGGTAITQAHDTMHMTGGAFAFAAGGFTIRGEGAHFLNRPYLRRSADLISGALAEQRLGRLVARVQATARPVMVPIGELFPEVDAAEMGLGIDYLWRGWQPVLQLNQVVFLEDDVPRLIVADPETRLTGTLRKRFFGDRIEFEVRGQWIAQREATFVFPRVSWRLLDDALRLRLGYLWIDGERASLVGQFRENDQLVLQARWSF